MGNIHDEIVVQPTTQELLNLASAEKSMLEGDLDNTDYAAIKKAEGCDNGKYEELFKQRAGWRIRINELKAEEDRLRALLTKEAEETLGTEPI